MKKRKTGKKTQAIRILDQKKSRQKQWRRLFRISSAFFLLSSLLWCWIKITNPQTFPISQVTIEGNYQHIDKQALKQTVVPYLNSNFFTVNMTGLRERLLTFPWLQSVFVWREWPGHLHIELTEQHPLAIWGDSSLVNTKRNLFFSPPPPFS